MNENNSLILKKDRIIKEQKLDVILNVTNKIIEKNIVKLFNEAFYSLVKNLIDDRIFYCKVKIINLGFFDHIVGGEDDFISSLSSSPPKENRTNAIRLFTEIISIDNRFKYAYFYRALAQIKFKRKEIDYEKAIFDLSKIIELDPEFTKAYIIRGQVFYNIKEYGLAIDSYTKAINLENTANFYFLRAKAKIKNNEVDAGIEDCMKSIECDNSYFNIYKIYSGLGIILREINNLLLSKEYLNKAIEIATIGGIKPIYAYTERSETNRLLNDQEGWLSDREKVYELDWEFYVYTWHEIGNENYDIYE